MRLVATALLLLAAAGSAIGGEPRRRPPVEAIIPIEPREHQRLHFFGADDRRLVPGTVSINEPPYVCDPHGARFADREGFVGHLRRVHRLSPRDIPPRLVEIDGRVYYVEPLEGSEMME